MTNTYLTVEEIAARLRCGEWHVRTLCRSGALRATKRHGRWYSTPEWADEYMEAGDNRAASVQRRRRRRSS